MLREAGKEAKRRSPTENLVNSNSFNAYIRKLIYIYIHVGCLVSQRPSATGRIQNKKGGGGGRKKRVNGQGGGGITHGVMMPSRGSHQIVVNEVLRC